MEIEGFFETDNIYIALWKKASIQRDYTKIREHIKNKDYVVKPPIFADQTCKKPSTMEKL